MYIRKIGFLLFICLIWNQAAVSEKKGLDFVMSPFILSNVIKETKADETLLQKLPPSIDLSAGMPPIGNQGEQNSSVAWAIEYVKSYYKFSPSIVFNPNSQLKGTRITILETLPVSFPSGSFSRVNFTDLSLIKYQLSKGNPLVVGILVYENFLQAKGNGVYGLGEGKLLGGQAVVVVGYDDSKKAFKVVNSWGVDWGENGFGYIDYRWFFMVCREAWVIQKSNNNRVAPPDEIYASRGNYKDRISVIWKPVPDSIGYIVYRRMSGRGGFQKVGITGNTKFDDMGVLSGRTYIYSVVSVFDEGQNSDFSMPSNGFRDENASNSPGKVVGLKASDNYMNKILLEWQPMEENCSYDVFKWDNKQNNFNFLKRVNVSKYTDIKANKKGYAEFYTIKPVCSGKEGLFSTAAIGRTSQNKQHLLQFNTENSKTKSDTPIIQFTSQVIPNNSNFDVVLNWSPIKNAEEYKIWENVPGQSDWKEIFTLGKKETAIKFQLPSLDTFYQYAITTRVYGKIGELSKPQTVAYSLPVESKLPRTFGVTSQLEKFKGVWNGMQWTKGMDVKNIVLKIDSDDNSTFVVTINNKKKYKGNYINDATSLTVGKKLQIELSKSEDALVVQLDDNSIVEEPAKLPFLRE
ncbi:MAG: hypothetical protein KDK90_14490 [Leptospiraceae bacterium]|nr:hypothetical protein [Leptospiraceae bacterium]